MTNPVPDGYTGPTATIRDWVRSESSSKALLFFVDEVNGQRIHNSLIATRNANRGRGLEMSPVTVERKVPAGPVRLKLVAQVVYGAPIQEIVNYAQLYSASDTIEFDAKPGVSYRVRGELAYGKSSVWLEDTATGERVGKPVEKQ